MGIETKYYTNANEPKSLGLASAAVSQAPNLITYIQESNYERYTKSNLGLA